MIGTSVLRQGDGGDGAEDGRGTDVVLLCGEGGVGGFEGAVAATVAEVAGGGQVADGHAGVVDQSGLGGGGHLPVPMAG